MLAQLVRMELLAAEQERSGRGDPEAATQSYVALWGAVQRQAAMLAFVDTFRAMAIVFLLVLPFLFIMKRPKHHRSAGARH